MMQRRNIRGHELKPNARQHAGTINAEKCIIYLRGVGVEIDDATADSWLDIQGTHRFLKSEKSVWRAIWVWGCRCGEMIGYQEQGRGRMRVKRERAEASPRARCEECDSGFVWGSRLVDVLRDGTVRDYRSDIDRIIPLRLEEFAGGL